eukprot:8559770-Ditylum_brightwellii.AAC.1
MTLRRVLLPQWQTQQRYFYNHYFEIHGQHSFLLGSVSVGDIKRWHDALVASYTIWRENAEAEASVLSCPLFLYKLRLRVILQPTHTLFDCTYLHTGLLIGYHNKRPPSDNTNVRWETNKICSLIVYASANKS